MNSSLLNTPAPRSTTTGEGLDTPRIERLTYRLNELAEALGVSRRSIERAKSSGRLPKPDLSIGKMPLWRVETIRRWVEGGGR